MINLLPLKLPGEATVVDGVRVVDATLVFGIGEAGMGLKILRDAKCSGLIQANSTE